MMAMGMAAALMLVPLPAGQAGGVDLAGALPTPRNALSAVWDGMFAYAFGGYDDSNPRLDQVVQYHPATEAVTVRANLSSGRSGTSAVWDGRHAYIFGGGTSPGTLREIVRFDPAADSASTMGATLDPGRTATSAVWDGKHAYVFGGLAGHGPTPDLDEIVRYDPTTDTASPMGAKLPTNRYGTSAVWDPRSDPRQDGTCLQGCAYVFGGDTQPYDEVVRYDPATDAVAIMGAKLPTGRYATSAAWDGQHAYVFGGGSGSGTLDEIVRYDPARDAVDVMGAALPSPRGGGAAVWAGGCAYVLGGSGSAGRVDEIVRYDPAPPISVGIADPLAGQAYLDDERLTPEGVTLPRTIVVGNKTVRAEAEDACGIAAVRFYVDGDERFVDESAPYSFTWEAGSEAAGDHTLMAEVVDVGGHVLESRELIVATLPTTTEGMLRSLDPLPPG